MGNQMSSLEEWIKKQITDSKDLSRHSPPYKIKPGTNYLFISGGQNLLDRNEPERRYFIHGKEVKGGK